MEIVLYLLIGLFFLLSLIGSFIPVIPDVLPIWGGIAIYYFFLNDNLLTQSFFISLFLLDLCPVIQIVYFCHFKPETPNAPCRAKQQNICPGLSLTF